jgi:hypothetical protein
VSHRTFGPIRLGCIYCDRQDCDGITEIPADWTDVQQLQSLVDSNTPLASYNPTLRCVLDWQTHLGVCPECQATHLA